MFVKTNRDIEKLKKFKETRDKLMKKKMKKKLSKRNFNHDMTELFEPPINQKKKKAEDLTKSTTPGYQKVANSVLKRLQIYDEITRRKNEFLKKLINSNKKALVLLKFWLVL